MTERCSSLVHVASGAAIFTILLLRHIAIQHRTAIYRPLFKPSVSLLSTYRQSSCVSNFYHTFKIFIWLSLVYSNVAQQWTSEITGTNVQVGAEPTDTFQMVIDNIWKKGKISETVYKYIHLCYLLPIDYKLIFWTSGRWPPFTSMHCCKRVWKLPYTRLRRSSSIAATSSTMACLSSWIVMIRLRNTRSFRNPHRKKIGTVRSGDGAGQAMSPKLRTQVTRCCTFQRSIATDLMKWRPLLYRSPSRQPRQAIAPAQYSNLKCVSRLRVILYKSCRTGSFRAKNNMDFLHVWISR